MTNEVAKIPSPSSSVAPLFSPHDLLAPRSILSFSASRPQSPEMNRPEFSSSHSPIKKKESRLQGPRPPHLKVSQDSFKIKKPPPHPHHFPPAAARPPLPRPGQQPPQPMIIYDISPKAILVEENDFMSVVQRLTGSLSSSSSFAYCGGDLSPAARLASIENASSPSERKRVTDANDVMSMVEASVELRPAPGVLSPLPATLLQIQDGFFSPVTDQYTLSFLRELSPYWQNGNGGFMASPTLFSAQINTPIYSPDIFSQLFNI